MKRFQLLVLLIFSMSIFAQTGIGTTTPVNKLQVETTTADPATSGATANGNFRLSGTSGSHVLDFGLSSTSTYSWLQSRSRTAYGTNFDLILNPNGGNVGIGSTSTGDRLVIGSSVSLHDGGNKVIGLGWSPGSGQALLSGFPAEIRLDPSSGRLSFGTSASLFATGTTAIVQQRMAITSQGNVGIGNNAPGATLEIGSSNGSVPGNLILNPTTTGTGVEGAEINLRPAPVATSPAAQTWAIDQVSDANNPRLRFFPGNSGETKGFTIKDNGYFGIGTASPRAKLHIQSADNTSVYIESTTTDNNGMVVLNANTNLNWPSNWHEFMYFQNQGTNIGGILGTSNGTQVIFSTTSDYRLKTDFKSFNGLDVVNKIKTYDYAWKSDQSRMYGVKAHELHEVLPYAVTGNKDAVDVQGKIIPQMVDYSKLTPILVKAIQEQDLKLNEQQIQIDFLKQQLIIIAEKLKSLENSK
ncbi:tail fiber domain-containing protein [Flavobacterium sp.]|jgi:hypothetical protein|uniref:tail fiber domain-containing protein n=1 Tax=Flavobacterium sp. TaxID=239 RepID=UPI0037BEFC33